MKRWWSNLEPEGRWIISTMIIIVILVIGLMGALKWQGQKAATLQPIIPITEPAPADEDSSADVANDDQDPKKSSGGGMDMIG